MKIFGFFNTKLNQITNFSTHIKNASLVCLILFAGCISLWTTSAYLTRNRIYPDINIAGIEVGGLPVNSAKKLIASKIKPPDYINAQYNNTSFQIQIVNTGFSYDYDRAIEEAYLKKRSSNPLRNVFGSLWIFGPKTFITMPFTYDKDKLNNEIMKIQIKLEVPGYSPSAKIENGTVVIDPGKDGSYVDVADFINNFEMILSTGQQTTFQILLTPIKLAIDEQEQMFLQKRAEIIKNKSIYLRFEDYTHSLKGLQIIPYIKHPEGYNELLIASTSAEISKQISREAQNSTFVFDKGKVVEFAPSKAGVTLNQSKFPEIMEGLLRDLENSSITEVSANVPVITTDPSITTESINNVGIKELIGKGTSKFKGSIASRVHNISLASSRFNGILIAPGETFSFNQILGDVSSLTGYKQAYIIKDGKTILGDGGGVCQVSTTLFRAILNAGLPVIERAPHSYRVYYYEQDSPPGMDATVYGPSPDLKFKNDTESHILIQTTFNSKDYTLSFELYGSEDGRIVNVSKPQITNVTPPPDDLYVDDSTLPVGTVKQIESKAWGAKVTFDYIVSKDGNEVFSKTFTSSYHPWQAKYLRGTKNP